MTTGNKKVSKGQILFSIVYVLLFPTSLLYLSGDWFWIEGWLFGIWLVALSLSTICYLYRRDPALLAERFEKPGAKGQKGWDKYFVSLLMVALFAWVAIIPLDAKKYEWTQNFPIGLKVLGGLFLLLCAFFMFRALAENTFASPLVRIQTERKQRVISIGVYSIVRHPMYFGGVLLFIGAPLMLGSLYGITAGVVMSLLLAGRIIGEERMLTKELEGYQEYKKRVKYRLIPFVW